MGSSLLIVNSETEEINKEYLISTGAFVLYYKWENNQFVNIYDTRIADWQTYKNEEYGFEFKYPDDYFEGVATDLKIINTLYVGEMTVLLESDNFNEKNNKYLDNISLAYTELGFDSFKNKSSEREKYGKSPLEFVPITVGSKQAHRFTTGEVQMGEVFFSQAAVFPLGNGSLVFYMNKAGGDFTEAGKNIFNQMLSTFKFLE